MSSDKKIPTVSTFRFLKNAKQILKNPLPFHQANFERLGDTFCLKVSPRSNLFFSRDPDFAEHILQKNQRNYKKSDIQTEELAKYVGHGLLTAEGKQWKTQRKLIQPAFHKKKLMLLLEAVQEAIVDELQHITTEKEIDIFPIMNDLAFQTVVKALFSNVADKTDIQELQHITETAQKMLISELRQPYKKWWFKLTGEIEKNIAFSKQSKIVLKKIIDKRKSSTQKTDDLLDMLLDARYEDGSSMTEDQLIDEILILFVAGHETTSNALTFACELLARNPQVQEKLSEEIITHKEESDVMTLIQKSQYANAVINEVMRMYPPVYFIDRVSKEADEINGFTIPKGANVLLSIFEIHHHQDFWENPNTFNPDRFLNYQFKNGDAYYPFGAGPRKCIGNNFAMYEMILALNELMKNFKIEPKSGTIEITPLISLKPKNAILKFTRR
ncbi:hypothetical protein SAMN05216480_10833 [Pustulibacterium marinum]|uniref:Cytochrome P450 n=1 Tax=Pustulibacterium marinum TaxID=1224947 RepID=A0A1I7HA99_9FLAO|nr:cytochrome P450 [Pustulibacterium marinum]SFU57607.1 hypothetical protein SAMN05216480_10833 [Pustulibacterium marinum]